MTFLIKKSRILVSSIVLIGLIVVGFSLQFAMAGRNRCKARLSEKSLAKEFKELRRMGIHIPTKAARQKIQTLQSPNQDKVSTQAYSFLLLQINDQEIFALFSSQESTHQAILNILQDRLPPKTKIQTQTRGVLLIEPSRNGRDPVLRAILPSPNGFLTQRHQLKGKNAVDRILHYMRQFFHRQSPENHLMIGEWDKYPGGEISLFEVEDSS